MKKVLVGLLILLAVPALLITAWIWSIHERFPAEDSQDLLVLEEGLLNPQTRDEFTRALQTYREDHGIPSISVAVGNNLQLVYAAAVGYADLDAGEPATTRTLYRIGSVSKSITAVAFAALMEAGLIELDADYHLYVPDFPTKRWPFNLRQLLSHTAGIRHYSPEILESTLENFNTVHYDDVMDSILLVADDPLLFQPGDSYSYSSYGYNLVSAAMQVAAEKPFADILTESVFEPSGMRYAHAENVLQPHPQTAGFYLQYEDRSFRAPTADNSYKIAGGGLLTTPSELVLFGNALLAGQLVSEATRERLFKPALLNDGATNRQSYGLGFSASERIVDGRTMRLVEHGGSSVGGSTAFLMYPEEHIVVAVTMNITPLDSPADPEDIAYLLADALLQEID